MGNTPDANKISSDVTNAYNQTVKSGQETIDNTVGAIQDTAIDVERGVLKTAGNAVGDLSYTARTGIEVVAAVADNLQDNVAEGIDNIRYDITNTVQVMFVVGAGLIVAAVIVYGDKLIDRGINLPSISIL